MSRQLSLVALIAILISSTISPLRVSARATQACEVIELVPGYPEYQGYSRGILYGPESVCRDYLESNYPDFSIEGTDLANRKAAVRLGIEGTEEVWTWENWIVISAEQGYAPVCWSCALVGTTPINHPSGGDVDTLDPRFASGVYGDRYFISRNLNPNGPYHPDTDFQIRVTSTLIWGDPYINSTLLISHYPELIEFLNTPGQLLDPTPLWAQAQEWGGHFPVPKSLIPEDQISFLLLALHNTIGFNDAYISVMTGRILQAADAWNLEVARGNTVLSFKDFFNDYWSD